jgi:hypothetical protein
MRACSLHRRQVLASGLLGGTGLILGGRLMPALAQAKTMVNFADIGVGDPGDWSKYTATSGASVNLVSIGNAPSAILNVLVGGGGTATYDVINIVGGMQKPLVENDLIDPDRQREAAELGQGQLYPRVPEARLARLQLHRLQGKSLRRPDRAPGRQLRLSPRGHRQP